MALHKFRQVSKTHRKQRTAEMPEVMEAGELLPQNIYQDSQLSVRPLPSIHLEINFSGLISIIRNIAMTLF